MDCACSAIGKAVVAWVLVALAVGLNSSTRAAELPNPMTSVTQENSTIGFAIASGGYLVESNLGSKDMYPLPDHTIEGYRTTAAVAKYSRVLAAEMYGPHRPYGYAYGGSGGAYKTVSLAENTIGVWDGVVPYVMPSPMATNVFSVQAYAVRILKDKMPAIVDAIDPGGSGDMYAGLNEEERAGAPRSHTRGPSAAHVVRLREARLRPSCYSHR